MEYLSPDPYIEKKDAYYQCNLCASRLNSRTQVQSHISGSSHRSRLNTVNPHQAATNMHSTEQKFSAFNLTAESNLPEYIEKHGSGYKCVCCAIPLNSNSQIGSHVSGAKHIKNASSFNQHNSFSKWGTNMEVENMQQPVNDHININMSPAVCNSVNSNLGSNLPSYIEKFGDQYRCECCSSSLNSYLQINAHVSGTKHIKAKMFYDANPALRPAKFASKNSVEANNMEESFDFYSDLKEINSEELMKNVKVLKANEEIIF